MTSTPIRIAAGTTNPAKLKAIRQAAGSVFGQVELASVVVDSSVPDQPWGDEQTAQGALNRARSALTSRNAELGIGIESGLVDGPGNRIYVVSWAAAVDGDGRLGFGGSERFTIPTSLTSALRAGAELGPLLDRLLGRPGLARNEGAVSIFTQGRRTRPDILSVAVLHALTSLLEPWRSTHSLR